MRCYSCQCVLNNFELTRRVESTQEFLDMCNKCYRDVEQDIPTVCRSDFNPNEQPDGYEEEEDSADVWLFDNDPDRY